LFIEPEFLELQTVMMGIVEVAQRVAQVLPVLASRLSRRGYLQFIAKQEVIVE
jgi:hypothetical protein